LRHPLQGYGSARVLTRSVLACGCAPRAASGRALAPSLFRTGPRLHRHALAGQQIKTKLLRKKNGASLWNVINLT